jgi:hypothetical protein
MSPDAEVRAATPVQHFVGQLVQELALGNRATDRRTHGVLLALTRWATGEGLALDREVLLDPDTVERFVEQGLVGVRSAPTYRSILRRLGPELTKQAPWEPRPKSIARRQVAPPFTETQVARLVAAAVNQPTPGRVRAARALLALGLGTGLDGRWVSSVRGTDVTFNDGVVLVSVGAPVARAVPVLADWECEVLELAQIAEDEALVGAVSESDNRTHHLTAKLVLPLGCPAYSPARLRSTWLLSHLSRGTRLPELASAAGLKGVTVLSDLLPLVTKLSPRETQMMLRGECRQ